jgi:cytochrome c553
MTTRTLLIPSLLIVLAAPAAMASPDAAALYQDNCLKCHGPEVYTRDDRKVSSLPGLQRQVQRCELALGLKWFDDEINAVADYLNENYYKLDR